MIRTLSLGLLLCGAVPGQGRVLTVDLGGGGQFTEIQPAIDAASPGDRIVVLGTFTYQAFTLSKGLDLEATQGAVVNGCSVRLVPLGQWARVAGFTVPVLHSPAYACVNLERCAGPVLLAGMNVPAPFLAGAMRITDCASVLLLDCVLTGGADFPSIASRGGWPALAGWNAQVAVQRGRLTGGAGAAANPQFLFSATPGGAGLSIAGGSVLVAGCPITGGPGGNGGSWAPAQGGPGIAMVGGDLLVFAGSVVAGGPHGQPWGGLALAVSGDQAYAAATRVTTDCTLTGGMQWATAIAPLPFLTSQGTAQLGGQASVVLRGPAGTVALLVFHALHTHLVLPAMEGALLVPPQSLVILFQMVLGASGSFPLTFSVPNDPALRHQFVFFQAVAFAPAAPSPNWTNLGDIRLR